MIRKHIILLLSVLCAFLYTSCEETTNFGFPSRIEISGKGASVDLKGDADINPGIVVLELLDYDGNGSTAYIETDNCLEVTTDWLTVKYTTTEHMLTLTAIPNETNKQRKLYLYLYDGRSTQTITIFQSK